MRILILFIPLLVMLLWWYLWYQKAVLPLQQYAKQPLNGMLSQQGIVQRLNAQADQRIGVSLRGSKRVELLRDGTLGLPQNPKQELSAADVAEICYLWALALWSKQNPLQARRYFAQQLRWRIIPLLGLVVAVLACVSGSIKPFNAILLWSYCWLFCALLGLGNLTTMWQVLRLAQQHWGESGLQPQLSSSRSAIEECLKAQPWLRLPAWLQ